jgi:hypothetical protein
MKTNEADEVEVMQVDGAFHLVTQNTKFKFYSRRMIPKALWEKYVELAPRAVDVRRQIELYFKEVRDKPIIKYDDENMS